MRVRVASPLAGEQLPPPLHTEDCRILINITPRVGLEVRMNVRHSNTMSQDVSRENATPKHSQTNTKAELFNHVVHVLNVVYMSQAHRQSTGAIER